MYRCFHCHDLHVSSDQARVCADADGDWSLRVEFPSAPANEYFTVDVSDGTETHSFDFVHTV